MRARVPAAVTGTIALALAASGCTPPFGGGFFFVLPGVKDADDYLGRPLFN